MKCICIDGGGTSTKLAVIENGTDILYREARPSLRGGEATVALISSMIQSTRERFPGAPAALSFAGYITPDGRVTGNQVDLWEYPLREKLREATGLDVPVENDGICALIAEKEYGALKGCSTGVLITLGTGIGGGVLSQGRVYRGNTGRSMEIGHLITHAFGRRCSCGQRGCWEEYASCPALSRSCGGLSVHRIAEKVRQGEYVQQWMDHIREICLGLMSLGSLFYPEKLVLGGGLANCGDLLLQPIKQELEKDEGWQNNLSGIQVCTATFLNDAGMIGAGVLGAGRKQGS